MPITRQDLQYVIPQATSSVVQLGETIRQRENQQEEEKLLKLKAYLGKQAADEEAQRDIGTLEKVRELAPSDASAVSYGKAHIGVDHSARLINQQTQGDAKARSQAISMYNKGLSKLQDRYDASTEGLDLSNDPNNPGSLGQARTLALKAMGMNRYNDKEAEAVVPPTFRAQVSNLFNRAGTDMSPLNESERSMLNQFFTTQLNSANQNHERLKQDSIGSYRASPYYNQQGEQSLSQVGAPMTEMFQGAAKKYNQIPKTQGPQLNQQPLPGPVDYLKSYLGFGQKTPQQAQPQQQATQTPQGMTQPSGKKVKVRRKSDGATGTMDAGDPALNSGVYEQVQ